MACRGGANEADAGQGRGARSREAFIMKQFLDFDDPGAQDDEPVKGLTMGDIRAWHDRFEKDAKHYLGAIRLKLERLYDVYPNDLILRELISDEVDWIDARLLS